MSNMLTVLVTGATGKQGGAVARLLLKKGHRVRALTRKPDSLAAQELKRLGVELATGNFEDRASVERAANSADAVFAMSTREAGSEIEIRQGITVADAAKVAGTRHLVFTSVGSADRRTGIPHFESKYKVEQHIQSLAIPHTIIGPVFFMENLLSPWWLPGLQEGKLAMALPASRGLQQVALDDIAGFAVLAMERREQFLGKRFDFASDKVTGPREPRLSPAFPDARSSTWKSPLPSCGQRTKTTRRCSSGLTASATAWTPQDFAASIRRWAGITLSSGRRRSPGAWSSSPRPAKDEGRLKFSHCRG